MSFNALLCIKNLLKEIHPDWENDRPFQVALHNELQAEFGIKPRIGGYEDCIQMEEAMKKVAKDKALQKKVKAIAKKIKKRLRHEEPADEDEEEPAHELVEAQVEKSKERQVLMVTA
jgi:hypothetical protein